MIEIKIADVINCLKDVYKSIDIRIAVGKEKDKDIWHSALTVIRFSYEDKENIQSKFEEIKKRLGEFKTDNFSIIQQVVDFEELNNLQSQFQNGKVTINDVEINLGRNIDMLSLKDRFPSTDFYTRRAENWPIMEVHDGNHSKIFKRDDIKEEIIFLGFQDVYSVVNNLLEIKFNSNISFDVVVCAPIYTIIRKIDFDFEKQIAKPKVEFHKDISDLTLHLLLRQKDRYDGTIKAKHSLSMDGARKLDRNFRLWDEEIELHATRDDFIIASLVHKKLGEIVRYDTSINKLFEENHPIQESNQKMEQDIPIDAKLMAESYIVLYTLENTLRKFIRDKLKVKFGDEWWENGVPKKIRTASENRKRKEIDSLWHDVKEVDMLWYTTFEELENIIQNNWDIFQDIFLDQHSLIGRLTELEIPRNTIAHNRLLEETELERLKLFSSDIFKCIRHSINRD